MDLSTGKSKQVLESVKDGGHALACAPHALQVVLGPLIELVAVLLEHALAQSVERQQRRPQVVRDRIAEGLELAVDRGQRGGSLLDERLEAGPISSQLLLRPIQLDEHRDLGAEDRRNDR